MTAARRARQKARKVMVSQPQPEEAVAEEVPHYTVQAGLASAESAVKPDKGGVEWRTS